MSYLGSTYFCHVPFSYPKCIKRELKGPDCHTGLCIRTSNQQTRGQKTFDNKCNKKFHLRWAKFCSLIRNK